MSEDVRKNEEQEEFSIGMAFMAFLMAIAALNGLWFFPVMIKMLTKMVS